MQSDIKKHRKEVILNVKNQYLYSSLQEDDIYSSFAKSARQEGIDPDDINLAIETIKTMRKGKGDIKK